MTVATFSVAFTMLDQTEEPIPNNNHPIYYDGEQWGKVHHSRLGDYCLEWAPLFSLAS